MIECISILGSGGKNKITDITTQYDKYTGKPYKVIWSGDRGFSVKTGDALTPPYFYSIWF